MSPEVHDALDAARTPRFASVGPIETGRRKYSIEHVRHVVLAVLREVPDGMTVADLRDELEIANNQGSSS